MTIKLTSSAAAFNRKELGVVIIVFIVAAILIFPALRRAGFTSSRLCCNCNLKQIGTAYRIWEADHFGEMPAVAPEAHGGWNSVVAKGNAGYDCWTNYVIMADNLGRSPEILICPADEREPARDFTNVVSNSAISYFVGVVPNDTYVQALLGGDRNIGAGPSPDSEYGYSPENGQGNDVVIKNPVCWSLKMHSHGSAEGLGNILLGDGSAQQVSSGSLRTNWIPNMLTRYPPGGPGSNLAAMRVIFP